MASLLDRIVEVWTTPPADDADGVAAFRAVYADPVPVNGTPMSARELLARARSLSTAFEGRSTELLDVVETPDRIAVAFVMRARHVGSWLTELGPVPPTGRPIEIRTIDVLTVTDGVVSSVWVVADELGALRHLGAVALAG